MQFLLWRWATTVEHGSGQNDWNPPPIICQFIIRRQRVKFHVLLLRCIGETQSNCKTHAKLLTVTVCYISNRSIEIDFGRYFSQTNFQWYNPHMTLPFIFTPVSTCWHSWLSSRSLYQGIFLVTEVSALKSFYDSEDFYRFSWLHRYLLRFSTLSLKWDIMAMIHAQWSITQTWMHPR